jgi:hypothetical protein
MNFFKKKMNLTIILFLVTVIIISHFFSSYISPFINVHEDASTSLPMPYDEGFTVNATLLNADGTPKTDSKSNPQTFQLDICGNDPHFQAELDSQINAYVKKTFNNSILPTLSTLNQSLSSMAKTDSE